MMKLKKSTFYIFITSMLMAVSNVFFVSAAEVVQDGNIATETDASEMVPEQEPLNQNLLTYIDDEERVGYYIPTENAPAMYSVIPSAYDSRNAADTGTYSCVTSVKNQNPYGTCWAFAAIGALESSMLAQGYVTDASSIDLSEYHFAYFFYHYAIDSLQGLVNDTTTAVAKDWRNRGNNTYFSMFALASWTGGADEATAPYDRIGENTPLNSELAFQDSVHMQNARVVSMKNRAEVKELIMENGSVVSGVYMCSEGYSYTAPAFYQTNSKISNHAILVIGWDDNYPVDNFKNTPSEPGAWLIKNSWGDDLPYLWVSYEDLCLSSQDAFAFYGEPATNYDFNYQYDGCETVATHYINNGDWIANVFTVSGATKERLEAVAIALADENIAYSVQIYSNPIDGNPLSGTPMLETPVTGQTTYVGYYTIPLDESIELKSGDKFAVVFTLEDMDVLDGVQDAGVNCYVDASLIGNWIRFDSYTESGLSYYYDSNDEIIYDFYEQYSLNCCARIKAFTHDASCVEVRDFDIKRMADNISVTALYDNLDKAVEFQWKIYNLQTKKWEMLQAWSTDDCVAWKPEKGNYWIRVEVRTGCGDMTSYTETYVSKNDYTKNYIAIDGMNLQYNVNSIRASADVLSNSDVEYQWKIYDIQTKKWSLLRSWSKQNDVIWQPTKGAYWLHVEARTSDGVIESYTKAYNIDKDYCSHVNLSAYCIQERSTGIAAGVVYSSNNPNVMFRWLSYNLTEQKWEIISDWSNGNWMFWKPKQGNYWLRVEAKTDDGATADYTQTFVSNKDYTKTYINLAQYCILNRSNDMAAGVVYDTNVGDIQFRWLAYDLSAKRWELIKNWSTGNWMSWKPKQGTYWLRVEAKTGDGVTSNYTEVINVDNDY